MTGLASFFNALWRRAPFLSAAAAPLLVAATWTIPCYLVFNWFDRTEASKARKRAVSAWLKGEPYQHVDLKGTVIRAFDQFYGSPLLSITGFFRASFVSLLIYIVFQWFGSEEIRNIFVNEIETAPSELVLSYSSYFAIFIVSDYISLIIVRRRLEVGFKGPLASMLLTFLAGAAVVFASYMVLLLALYGLDGLYQSYDYHKMSIGRYIGHEFEMFFIHPEYYKGVVPALFVNAWLLLFALGYVVLRVIFWFFRAVRGFQCLIKRGDERPFTAIGMVAAVLVFTVALALQLA